MQGRERAALQVLGGDRFQRLPARDDVDAVADDGVAGHGAHARVGEPARQQAVGLAGELGVGVKGHDDLALGLGQAAIERQGLAAVLEPHQPHTRLVGEMPHDLGGGAVARAVVEHNDFQVGPGGVENPAHRTGDDLLFVETGDQDADQWPAGQVQFGGLLTGRAQPVNQRQYRQEGQPPQAECDGGQEQRPQRQVDAAEEAETDAVQHQFETVAAGRGQGLGRGHAGQLVHGHQAVAMGAQGVDQAGQGLDRAAAVAAGVVQQDDLTAGVRVGVGKALDGAVDDVGRVRLFPVVRVDA